MANDSECYGKCRLVGKWTPKMIKLLRTVADEWRNWYYNFDLYEHVNRDKHTTPSISFSGTGRWGFDLNVENLHKWTVAELNKGESTKLRPVYIELLDLMAKENSYLSIEFVDRDGAVESLYKSWWILYAGYDEEQGGSPEQPILVSKQINYEQYEWTPKNEKLLGFGNPWPREIEGKTVTEYEQFEKFGIAV